MGLKLGLRLGLKRLLNRHLRRGRIELENDADALRDEGEVAVAEGALLSLHLPGLLRREAEQEENGRRWAHLASVTLALHNVDDPLRWSVWN